MSSGRAQERTCFVTVGATAGFRLLLEEVLSPLFLQALAATDFNTMIVQCGPDEEWFGSKLETVDHPAIEIRHLAYTDDMRHYMLKCRRPMDKGDGCLVGCVIGHAGAGTILECMRYQIPMVAVANPSLMNNHQAELAQECEDQGWVVHGHLGQLHVALERSLELIIQGRLDQLPPYSPPPFPVPESERIAIFDWVLLTCYPAELDKQLRYWQGITAPESPQQDHQAYLTQDRIRGFKRPAEEDLHRMYE